MVAMMSQYAGLFSVIVAGYEQDMMTCFLGANEGFPRRFANKILLPNYSANDLYQILNQMVVSRLQNDSQRTSANAGTYKMMITSLNEMYDQEALNWLAGKINEILQTNPKIFRYQAGDMQNLADIILNNYYLYTNPVSPIANKSIIDNALQIFIRDKELIDKYIL
jgi:hypothetical protein